MQEITRRARRSTKTLRNGWADGPVFVTQCPIRPGASYTYRFTIQKQEGTLWWHAHNSWLRATVHGAIVIRPKEGTTYPFPKPQREFPVIIETTILPVAAGETNLLRFVNAAMENEHFISIAGHSMTVVGIDAAYTKPYTTPYLMLAPGQTTDVLVTTNQPPGRYYLAAHVYESGRGIPFDNTTTTAILEYKSGACGAGGPPPRLPVLPAFNDTPAKTAFVAGLRSLGPVDLPGPVDEHLFFTVGLGLFNCPRSKPCGGPNGTRFGASMNNISFTQPRTVSILQADYFGIPGVFTSDFPPVPPIPFDYTANNISRSLQQPVRGTKVYRLKFGSVVQLVMQGTNIFVGEEHPMHIHGYQFYVLATGFGNYDPVRDPAKFNLVDPPMRNTVGVPVSGWAVIRFRADNPGIWFVHCHIDSHLTWGLAMAFQVENGVGLLESVLPPPVDLPIC
ncbi:Laccase-3 [Ananas comosus]|uniref:laccase n=1 Tax=Ananas comosus TaxID=4615 RepID=A0A199WA10_ANACO|nr:Laccase-3 [Ananas comosus]